jgi:hypothetical protein
MLFDSIGNEKESKWRFGVFIRRPGHFAKFSIDSRQDDPDSESTDEIKGLSCHDRLVLHWALQH